MTRLSIFYWFNSFFRLFLCVKIFGEQLYREASATEILEKFETIAKLFLQLKKGMIKI